MTFAEIEFNSDLYAATLKLRDEVLRAPLGLRFSGEDLAGEERELHFGMVDDGALVACLVIKPLGDTRAKLRQMAVADTHRGKGLGRQLVCNTEEVLRAKGFTAIELSARETAIGFYKKLGYAETGAPFEEVGIAHRTMVKQIARPKTA
jgi:predicted GNAT family N-acyltransferase